MLIRLISLKQRFISPNKRQKVTIENVEFIQIISYKTSLFKEEHLSSKSTFSVSTSKSYALALYELEQFLLIYTF